MALQAGTPSPVPASEQISDQTERTAETELIECLTRPLESCGDAEVFLADLKTLEQAAETRLSATPRLVEAALDEARGYKRMARFSVNCRTRTDLVVEFVLPAFGPAIVPKLLEGYDPAQSWSPAGRLAAIGRIDPGLGHRLCLEALSLPDSYLQEVILDGLQRIAPEDVEGVALEMLERGFGRLGSFYQRGIHVSRVLERLGSLSEATWGRLLGARHHANPKVRGAAAHVLKGLGPRGRVSRCRRSTRWCGPPRRSRIPPWRP